jgi:hypothetical protein
MSSRTAFAAALLLLAVPGAAHASQIQLAMQTSASLVSKQPGLYVGEGPNVFAQLQVSVLDDAGRPISDCLQSGAVHVTIVGGPELGTSTCGTNGVFTIIPPSALKTPAQLVARVDDSSLFDGTHVSAAQSAPITLSIRPQIDDQSPFTHQGPVYPIKGEVAVPDAPHAGVVLLQHQSGKHWRSVARRPLSAFGKYLFHVRVTTHAWQIFKVSFIPAKGSGWALATEKLRIRRL